MKKYYYNNPSIRLASIVATRIIIITLFMMNNYTTSAGPAMRRFKTVTQSNGDTLTLTKAGDEHHHFYLTRDNIPVIKKNGAFFYADRIGPDMKASSIMAHNKAQRTQVEIAHIQQMKQNTTSLKKISSSTNNPSSESSSTSTTNRKKTLRKASSVNYKGSKKGLIILVQFTDQKFSMSDPKSTYEAIANQEGYVSPYGTTGSVHDYFKSQSYEQFDLTFDVIGPITLDHAYSYYGGNDDSGDDIYPGRMIIDALNQISSSDLDFSKYDWNGDGEADQVFVLYAGQGEASSDIEETIWPHEWSLQSACYYDYLYTLEQLQASATSVNSNRNGYSDRPGDLGLTGGSSSTNTVNADSLYRAISSYYSVSINGITFDTYACSNESYVYNKKTFLMGIGTICHEFSHCLGFPDFYDTTGSNYGMGYYDVMDAGSYNGPMMLGWVPAGYTSYERHTAGWLDYSTLNDNTEVSLSPLNNQATAYIIPNEGYENEYLLLENRQQTGWDTYIPGKGLLVLHVDYDKDAWENNTVNSTTETTTSSVSWKKQQTTEGHQHLTIIHADNDDAIRYYSNVIDSSEIYDTYPYVVNNTVRNDSLTDYSSPAAILYHTNTDGSYLLHSPIYAITQQDNGDITFVYNPLNGYQEIIEEATEDEETNAITTIKTSNNVTVVARYNAAGIKINQPIKGINILRMSNGSIQKVIEK